MITNVDVLRFVNIDVVDIKTENFLKSVYNQVATMLYRTWPASPFKVEVTASSNFIIHSREYAPNPDLFKVEFKHSAKDMYWFNIWIDNVNVLKQTVYEDDDMDAIITMCRNQIDNLLFDVKEFYSLETIFDRSVKQLITTAYKFIEVSNKFNKRTEYNYYDSMHNAAAVITANDTHIYWINIDKQICWKKVNTGEIFKRKISVNSDIELVNELVKIITETSRGILMEDNKDLGDQTPITENDELMNDDLPVMISKVTKIAFVDNVGYEYFHDDKKKNFNFEHFIVNDADGFLQAQQPTIDVYILNIYLENGYSFNHYMLTSNENDNLAVEKVYKQLKGAIMGTHIKLYKNNIISIDEVNKRLNLSHFSYAPMNIH